MGWLHEMHLEVRHLVTIGSIILAAIIITRITRWLISRFVRASAAHLKIDATRYRFFSNAMTLVIYSTAFFLVIYTIPSLRSLALTLFAGAGILVAIVGFAAQQAFANIVSGVFLVISRPYRVGDLIKVKDTLMGHVEDITLRHTVIRDFENKRIIIPNSTMNSETIINSDISDPRVCEFLNFGISYDSDIDLAFSIIRREVMAHPLWIDGRTPQEKANGEEPVDVRVVGFGDSSVNIRGYAWAPSAPEGRNMRMDLFKSIKEAFDREGIEIPFPYRTIVYKKDI
ncbi:MAG: mechanosensitive ion channel family protein [Flavobacteriales bacterium]|nr:mechanosensitive ion channel family protein [Flavobacteriales bacterium]MCB9448639.1 mechanosensitive ion channel family protein [Flavobacteriales bacterium]